MEYFFSFPCKKLFFISLWWETHYSLSARFPDGQALPVLPAQLRPGGLNPGDLLPAWGGLLLDTALLSRSELFDLRMRLEFPNNFFFSKLLTDPAHLRALLGRLQPRPVLLPLHGLAVGVRQGEAEGAR